MKFTHAEGEDAAGRRVSVAPHLKPEVGEDGTFEVSEDTLEERGVDPEVARERLEDAGHSVGEPEVSEEDESQDDEEPDEQPDQEEEESESGENQEPEPATKTDLMNLKKDQLVEIAEEVEGVETDQNKEPLAEDLAGEVALEDE